MSGDLKRALRELTAKVMGRKGVTGTAIGSDSGSPCLKVYVSRPGMERSLPESVGGFTVLVELTGDVERL